MQIVFRVDASTTTGAGHVARCLTLARAMRERGAVCRFVCRANPGNLIDTIQEEGFDVFTLGSAPSPFDLYAVDWQTDARETRAALDSVNPDWVIIDHYGLGQEWEELVAPRPCKRLVIDDLCAEPHAADIILNQNLGVLPEDYSGLVPKKCLILTGPKFALLRPEFKTLRKKQQPNQFADKTADANLLISFGGTDPPNATGWALDRIAAHPLPPNWTITVVMGAGAPALAEIKAKAAKAAQPTKVIVNASNMAELMSSAQLALGGGGATSWERCCMGLPCIMVILAENQRASVERLSALAAADSVALHDDKEFDKKLKRLLEDTKYRSKMANASIDICDGVGTMKVANSIVEQSAFGLRPTLATDAELIWRCRKTKSEYPIFRVGQDGTFNEHLAWIKSAVNDPKILFFTGLADGIPIGYVRFNRSSDGTGSSVSICLDKAAHGRGLGSKFLNMACQSVFQTGDREIRAEIHKENIPSQRLFVKCGFRPSGNADPATGFAVYIRQFD